MSTRLNPQKLQGSLINTKTGAGNPDFLDFMYRLWNRTGSFGGVLGIGSGGTNSDTAAGARVALGLEIGTNVQAQDPSLESIAGLTTSADRFLYTTGADVWTTGTITNFARSLLDDINESTARTTLGLAIGTNVQAYNVALQSIASLTTAANKMIYTTAANSYAVTDLTAFAITLLDDADAATARTTLGLGSANAPTFAGLTLTGPLIANSSPPASAAATGTAGTITYDSDYIYVCTATDTWKRVAIATW